MGAIDSSAIVCLVVEDDIMHRLIAGYLGENGVRTVRADCRDDAITTLAKSCPDLVIIDLGIRKQNGFDFLRETRAQSDVPVIIITGDRQGEFDCVVGLELGADDCVIEPFDLREFLARVRSVIRRWNASQLVVQRQIVKGLYRFGGWCLDGRGRRLTSPAGKRVILTKREYVLLLAFLSDPLRPLSRDHLLQTTRVYDDVFDRTIDVEVLRLRRKLKADAGDASIIRTERGIGYTFCLPVEAV
jgi:two-component system, OmpR family, response regulator